MGKFNIQSVVRFLFPEWQIVEVAKEKGFIHKRSKQQAQAQTKGGQQQQGQERRPVYGGGTNAAPRQVETAPHAQPPAAAAGPSSAVQSADFQGRPPYQAPAATAKGDASEDFRAIRQELGRFVIGQEQFLDQLCIAFKRPFVAGFDPHKPRSVMLILGGRGSGKRSSIGHMMDLMVKRKLASTDVVMTMDLSLYTTVSEFGVFLSDLYKCLYTPSDIVVFRHYDKCHSSVLDVITTLSLKGSYTLDGRYIVQNNNLFEATGTLLQSSVSELSAGGKYFAFTSERSEQDALNTFGTKFMDQVADIVHTESWNERDLHTLAGKLLDEFRRKCTRQLSMTVDWDAGVVTWAASSFREATGVSGLSEVIEASLYKPLAEYKLRRDAAPSTKVELTVAPDGELKATIQGEAMRLLELLPPKRSTGLDEVKQELGHIVGIESVKQYVLQLEDHLKIQQRREQAGHQASALSMHMIFTGNPGTGKTTIARIVAKYLKALGVLSTGQLREVTRADLVGQYVGQTAKQTRDVINSALGGVLFIDEAYALCRDKHDTFGLEAIDTLVKGIEDHRHDLVVILAGYKDEMADFLKVNSGLKSRFPNIIDFEDYTSQEMTEIAQIIARTKGYKIAEDCGEALVKLFDKKQVKGRNDSGNGRLVRNVIEAAVLNQSKRLAGDPDADLSLLNYADFHFEDESDFDLEASLAQIIGLNEVKSFVTTQYQLLIAQEKRRKAGLQVDTTQSLNMIFSGNPGTGKTTIARVVATMFKEMGLLKSGHLVETDRGGLIAEYAGQTAKKTEDVFRSALGGVLFIDEAYALTSDGGSYGMEAVNTLVKLIEDYRGEILVILAGYKKEMEEFLKSNSGLDSRFPLKIEFPDYTADELHGIALKMISAKGFTLAGGTESVLREHITALHKHSDAHSGNGRMVRNALEEITRNQSARIAMNDVAAAEMNVILPMDILPQKPVTESFDLEAQLAKIIGLDEVKGYIRSLSARLRMQHERKKLGLAVDSSQTLHMIFKGNPGTGKTMVARTVAQVLYSIGVIKTDKLVETDRSGLVAGYVGQTAIKTKEVVMEAMDGVLFIDEAYALSSGGANDFGKEAIDTLVKLMDDHRDRLVVILAGYSEDMDGFLGSNPGLKSRFPNIIEFADYDAEELMQIAELIFTGKGYELDAGAEQTLRALLAEAVKEAHFGNGRYVRNVFERAVNQQAIRLSLDKDLTREELVTITATDIERV